jgi:hypothetical protein
MNPFLSSKVPVSPDIAVDIVLANDVAECFQRISESACQFTRTCIIRVVSQLVTGNPAAAATASAVPNLAISVSRGCQRANSPRPILLEASRQRALLSPLSMGDSIAALRLHRHIHQRRRRLPRRVPSLLRRREPAAPSKIAVSVCGSCFDVLAEC